jgi:hypothetical protein
MTCQFCGRTLGNSEPSYRVLISWLDHPRDRRFPSVGYICEQCVMLEDGLGGDVRGNCRAGCVVIAAAGLSMTSVAGRCPGMWSAVPSAARPYTSRRLAPDIVSGRSP